MTKKSKKASTTKAVPGEDAIAFLADHDDEARESHDDAQLDIPAAAEAPPPAGELYTKTSSTPDPERKAGSQWRWGAGRTVEGGTSGAPMRRAQMKRARKAAATVPEA